MFFSLGKVKIILRVAIAYLSSFSLLVVKTHPKIWMRCTFANGCLNTGVSSGLGSATGQR